jgi:hypothetical protein
MKPKAKKTGKKLKKVAMKPVKSLTTIKDAWIE